jgi:predicted O-linked N-acetylglucosamine transferase (SPINDLY family)
MNNEAEALVLSGKSKAAQGRLREAAGDLQRALALQPRSQSALLPLGMVLALLGEHQKAQPVLERALGLDRTGAQPLFGLGLCRLGGGDWRGAEGCFREALARDPKLADARNNLGVALDRQGRLAQAAEEFRLAIALRPQYLTAHLNFADAMMRLGQPAAAIPSLQAAARLNPQDAGIHADLGAAQLADGDFAAARQTLEHCLSLDSQIAAAAANLGEALRRLGEQERAAAAFERALSLRPDLAEAHLGLAKIEARRGAPGAGARLLEAHRLRPTDEHIALDASRTLDELGQQQQALAVLQGIARVQPAAASVHAAIGDLLQRLGRFEAAAESFEHALKLEPERGDWWLSLASAQESLARYAEAMSSIERAGQVGAGPAEQAAALYSCAVRVCDWKRTARALEELGSLPLGIDTLPPFLLLATEFSPPEQAESMRRHGRRLCRSPRQLAPRRHQPARIAYISPDIREHPVAHALAGVIARHDRSAFSPIAVALTAEDASEVGGRLRASFDEVIDASRMSDRELERVLLEREIDIAIDLAGHTVGARPALFGRRVAPIQINYLGFSTSTGLETMDFIIADAVTVPPEDEPLYTERVLRMPHSYLPFDNARELGDGIADRRAAGLPEDGFVFCAFNNAYKICEAQFDIWISLLHEVPGSVLWLRQMNDTAASNLRAALRARSVDPERLIFAPYLNSMPDHLARFARADVFLDTLPYNAHTTAAEALWAGVPLITCRGSTFAGRVGASLLHALGMPDLIAADFADYRRLALTLARSPDLLQEYRGRLGAARASAPLFDTARYTRDLEQLLHSALG